MPPNLRGLRTPNRNIVEEYMVPHLVEDGLDVRSDGELGDDNVEDGSNEDVCI
jgi:hypothetical protein